MLYYVKGRAHLVQGIRAEGIMHAAFSRVGRMEVEVMVEEVLMGSLGAVGL